MDHIYTNPLPVAPIRAHKLQQHCWMEKIILLNKVGIFVLADLLVAAPYKLKHNTKVKIVC